MMIELGYFAPYDVAALLRFVAQRAIPGVEQVGGRRILRTLRAGAVSASASAGWIEVTFAETKPVVELRIAPELAGATACVIPAVRRWLDLDATPQVIDTALSTLPGAPGLRLPGGLDAFELAIRAVLGQQITVAGARTLARRMVERFGASVITPWPDVMREFPAPATLANTPVEQIAELGIVRARACAINAIAQAWPEIARLLAPHASIELLIETLCSLRGIGPWTAHYIAMRARGWPDAFPPRDVAVLKAMNQLFGTETQREAHLLGQTWQPWRSYAVLRLWNTLEKGP